MPSIWPASEFEENNNNKILELEENLWIIYSTPCFIDPWRPSVVSEEESQNPWFPDV